MPTSPSRRRSSSLLHRAHLPPVLPCSITLPSCRRHAAGSGSLLRRATELSLNLVEVLSNVKAVHVATGDYTTFVVCDNGDVYSFGCGELASLGHNPGNDDQGNRHANVSSPELVTSLKEVNERVVHISLTNSIYWNPHTFALTESGKLYAFGAGDKGQLGVELIGDDTERGKPERVYIDLG